MAFFIGLFGIIFLALIFSLFLYNFHRNSKAIKNFPLLGLLPELILHLHRAHDKIAEVLEERKGTFLFNGGWLGQMNMLITSDPENVYSIMNANFSNYVKGPEWRKRFDIFGDHSIFNVDMDKWKRQRKIFRAFLSHQDFHQNISKIIPNIIEKALIPVLDKISEQDSVVDLQDLFSRYTFDFACLISTGSNPNSLSSIFTGLAENAFVKALEDACETVFVRIVIPESFWKLQRWLGIGMERKYREGWETIDRFCAKHLSIRQEKLTNISQDQEVLDLLKMYLTRHDISGPTPSPNVIRDNVANLIFAAGDTTSTALSWFFWLLSRNPSIEIKIREELTKHFPSDEARKWRPCNLEQLNKLVYLHAAICEALRLFPPAPYELRTPLRPETLPSGHQVDKNTNIVISAYAMGRMASIWGEDCLEFKPERWIKKDGGIKHEPSHKFFAFLAGPRICLGKEIGFTLMKAIITTIIHNFYVQVVEKHPVIPSLSIVFRMKHGLMARIKSRWA